MNSYPLVSVCVICFNSAKTIVDTLNSIYSQTYSPIELVISDDCSTDSTIDICKKWVEQHSARFRRVVFVTSPSNTGISANNNRGEANCSGEWIKPIAGDDLLLPDTIEKLLNFVNRHPDAYCICGKITVFGENIKKCNEESKVLSERVDNFAKLSESELLQNLMNGITPPAAGLFYNLNVFRKLGITYDERIPFIEDVPHWINILKKNVKIWFIDNYLVYYRFGDGISTSNRWLSPIMYKNRRLLFFLYQLNPTTSIDSPECLSNILSEELDAYTYIYDKYVALQNSPARKIGKIILYPLHFLKTLFHKNYTHSPQLDYRS